MSINLNLSEVENTEEVPQFGNDETMVNVPDMIMDTESNLIVEESETYLQKSGDLSENYPLEESNRADSNYVYDEDAPGMKGRCIDKL